MKVVWYNPDQSELGPLYKNSKQILPPNDQLILVENNFVENDILRAPGSYWDYLVSIFIHDWWHLPAERTGHTARDFRF